VSGQGARCNQKGRIIAEIWGLSKKRRGDVAYVFPVTVVVSEDNVRSGVQSRPPSAGRD
jgi:hypothetical protein